MSTPKRVARLLNEQLADNPLISTRDNVRSVTSEGIYSRQPVAAHLSALKSELEVYMASSREIYMVTLEGYCALLQKTGHLAEFIIVTGQEIKVILVIARKLIFRLLQRDGFIVSSCELDHYVVNILNINEKGRYYGRVVFI